MYQEQQQMGLGLLVSLKKPSLGPSIDELMLTELYSHYLDFAASPNVRGQQMKMHMGPEEVAQHLRPYCSCRGPRFHSQLAHGGSQPS